MDVSVLDELGVWLKENIFDEPEPSPEIEIAAEEAETETLSENARLYQWCPRRKRLVQSR